MPSIHYSSFEAGLGLTKAEEEESGDAALLGFLDQTRNVLTGVEAALQRALDEGWSMVLEGVHLVPGMITTELRGALVVQCVLAIHDEEIHRTHFWIRDADSDGVRPVDRYIAGLPEIRMIQEYIARARAPVRRACDRERVAGGCGRRGDELVLEQAERAAQGVRDERAVSETPLTPAPARSSRGRPSGPRWRARAGSAGTTRTQPRRPPRARCSPRSSELPISGTIVIGPDDGDVLRPGSSVGAGGEAFDLAVDPLEGRGVVARGGNGAMSMLAVGPPGSLLRLPDMYMRRMAVGPRAKRQIDLMQPVAENVAAVARRVRAQRERHHGARARPAASPRPDRGDPRRRRPDQADPGRRRDRVDLGGDPRHERPPRGRDRRHAPGGPLGRGAALPRRRAPGAALADHPQPRSRRPPSTGSTTSTASSRPTISRRAR